MTRPRFFDFRLLTAVLLGSLVLSMVAGCTADRQEALPRAASPDTAQTQEPVELAALMGDLQRYTHKMTLSAHEENLMLTRFYLHEMLASTAEIKQKVPTYEGYSIRTLMNQIFTPRIDTLDTVLVEQNWDRVGRAIDDVIRACNTCHSASAHGFIQITEGLNKNPYNQTFEAQE